jgi:hypothetical protein
MTDCFFCGSALPDPADFESGATGRVAYDPGRGRLWGVCPTCLRWNPVSMEDRWETLEACERTVHDRGRIRLASDQLALVSTGPGELIRIGAPPRVALASWRYGDALPRLGQTWAGGLLARLLSRFPSPPLGGSNPYGVIGAAVPPAPWLRSSFVEHAADLTFAFTQVPFAPRCGSCREIMPLAPWDFSELAFLDAPGGAVLAECGSCQTAVEVPLAEARPALRLGLGVVTRTRGLQKDATDGARVLEEADGPMGLLRTLSRRGQSLGTLNAATRVGLIIGLDELAEVEALEREWREAEEIASIMDGELTRVPGFEAFRRRILSSG